ncbi:uncharacterized protein TRUGW13939_07173 [Talaromyces rugulosus]|uniref:Uncharacterized protein n=1 Tax=Talaromyces rugulosus TaxID=121627 RepID=A0A7H8R322_TALRU|nr:uncharacterized protein TRUGW13939_07173 [Talaromyces rugulosus]QKX60031.1 hypothetical protein TRUGW13939_07173 [Talaromyces rugulosus]
MRLSTLIPFLALALVSAAAALTTDQLLTISPNSLSCANAPAAGECATAADAVPIINDVFTSYLIYSPGEQAALLSLMAFETGDFKYNRNHFPGVAGQGTRNMQSPSFNKQYASSIPEIKDRVNNNVSATLDLLLSRAHWDFGSAAWFLTTQCSEEVRLGLLQGSQAGWEAYISGCVNTTVTEERRAYWKRAVDVLF